MEIFYSLARKDYILGFFFVMLADVYRLLIVQGVCCRLQPDIAVVFHAWASCVHCKGEIIIFKGWF